MATGAAAGESSPQKSSPQKSSPHKSSPPRRTAQPSGLRIPTIPVPHVRLLEVHLPTVTMPGGTAGRVVWWGGLATVAAFGVVDWPVAALVAAGTWVAEQQARQAARSGGDRTAAGSADS